MTVVTQSALRRRRGTNFLGEGVGGVEDWGVVSIWQKDGGRKTSHVKSLCVFLFHARPLTGSCCVITTLRGGADSAVRRVAAGTRLHFNVFISYANTGPAEPVIIHREPSPDGNDSVLRIYYSWPPTGQAARGKTLSALGILLLFITHIHSSPAHPASPRRQKSEKVQRLT